MDTVLITRLRLLVALIVAVGLTVPLTLAPASAHEGHGATDPFDALVFSKTAGFRHGSIPVAVAAIEQLGDDHGFTVTATEDAAAFTDANLAQYEVVIWVSTTGDVLNESQQGAFERYIQGGGGYAGIHSASDTEYSWPWYGDLVGAYFKDHPANQTAAVKVEDPAHSSTAGMSPTWNRFDEWYNYQSNPRGDVHVVASLDESSYAPGGGAMGHEHPISWCQDYDGGRSWYTGMGHTDESYAEPQFLTHILGGIRTAAGVQAADCAASLDDSFEKITLDDNTANPMELDIADDGRVFYIDRGGDVRVISTSGTVSTAGHLNVTTVQEFGLLGLALDPDFATNRHLFVYWSPANEPTQDRVSRFTLTAGGTLDMASEKIVMEVDVQRAECCHAGGALEFDNDGNLYIATGDNTNPFASDGYAPIDERAGRASWDAQGTSANSNSLSGKVLRITPQADGTYTIPTGNLFPTGTAKTRPEIYGMGFRNPFRIGLDEQTGRLLVADYGPDAGSASATRGPGGRVEWNILSQPGNYGWPQCVAANTPYMDYDFATGQSSGAFSCANPVNNSPNNTGLTNLPPAIPATMWQGNDGTANPEIGQSGAPMTSGTYAYDAELESDRKWPAYFDGKAVWADWNNSRMFTVLMNADHTDDVDVSRFLQTMPMTRPHALQFGPDGALYMIEWGSGFGGNNADSGIYRIDYVQGNRAPIAEASADKTSGPTPLTVQFSSDGSRDPDGSPLTYSWDFDGNGTADSIEADPSHTFTDAGEFEVQLTVTDEAGRTGVSNLTIVAGNTAPEIEVVLPRNGGFFDFGDSVKYEVTGSDAEDGSIDCERVVVQPALGHDQHSHPYGQYAGCTGVIAIPGDEGHVGANIFGTVAVRYTDEGAAGTVPVTTEKVVILHPKRREAEYFEQTGRLEDSTSGGSPGVQVEDTGDAQGGSKNVGFIEAGDWFGWDVMNLTGIDTISMRAASPLGGGALYEVRTGDPDTGETVATIQVANTGDWQTYQNFSAEVTGDTTEVSGPLYFVEISGGSNINWIDFGGRGATDNQRPSISVEATPVSGTAPLEVDLSATVADPEGDTPLTVDWTFGDGESGQGADVSHTYTEPGTYTAQATVTDSRGAVNHDNVEITVSGGGLGSCFSGRSDDFTGTTLDHERWDSIVRENQDYSVSDGQLHLPLTATDIHGGGTATKTPNIILQRLPGGAFEVTTKMTLEARRQYQQAGLILYGDDNNYLKMVMQGRTSTPDAAGRVFQFLGEIGGNPTETNTPALGAAFPDTFWVRMSSNNGLDVSASYSTDGITFTPMPGATRSLAGVNEPRVGLFGAVNQEAALPITAHFDNFRITPDDSVAAPDPDDEFGGDSLDACRWNAIVRPDAADVRVTGGKLEIDTPNGDIYGAGNTDPKNFVLQQAPEGDWVMETKVDGSALDEQYQQGGLIAYAGDDDYVKLDYLTTNTAGSALQRNIELRSEVGGAIQNPQPNASPAPTQGVWHLRLTKSGDDYTGAYSADGTTWTTLGTVSHASLAAENLRIGLFTIGTAQAASKTVTFDYFHLDTGDEPPVDETAPEVSAAVLGSFAGDVESLAGNEIGGEATMDVAADGTTATLSLTGLDPEGVYQSHLHVGTCASPGLHYMDDPEGPGMPPNELWPVSEGMTPGAGATIEVAADGTAEAAATVPWAARVGARALMVHDEGAMVACATLSLAGPGEVVLDATDDQSGLDSLNYRVDGGEWTAYDEPFKLTEPGSYTVDWRADDVAGNETTGSFPVVVPEEDVDEPPTGDTTPPVVQLDLLPAGPDGTAGWYRSEVKVKVGATDESPGSPKVEYRIDGGAWTGYDGAFWIRDDGTHQVSVRATDAAGNTSAPLTRQVSLDRVAPTVTVTGLKDGAELGLADLRSVSVAAGDVTSGLATTSITLDDSAMTSPVAVDAVSLLTGSHTLRVTATDKAGHSTTTALVFEVVATYDGAFELVHRLKKDGLVSKPKAKKLVTALLAAQRADVRGQEKKARKALTRFVKVARTVGDTTARTALVAAGKELRADL